MNQTLVDVVKKTDWCERPVSDGLIVDDGVTGHDHLVDYQRSFLRQWCQNASLGHGRNSDDPLRLR